MQFQKELALSNKTLAGLGHLADKLNNYELYGGVVTAYSDADNNLEIICTEN